METMAKTDISPTSSFILLVMKLTYEASRAILCAFASIIYHNCRLYVRGAASSNAGQSEKARIPYPPPPSPPPCPGFKFSIQAFAGGGGGGIQEG